MWRPNKTQWIVLWFGLLLAFLLWLPNKEFSDLHIFVIAVVVLLFWMVESRKNRSN